ncbi:hypothetical protein A2154_02630 [Candidatus Gottesmanbacteria bacterium RBG_16_43_7]|uniref:Translation elongation factor-like protein n=1 Tax=Candidatus Gottesmanbacteria bacterium RBG_16_43_7 TaxID=1798373 RepID=A0A1F5ZD22_9BACT|nr:MAG: hypothetical protein A2154_02630 [Candidatus Gottesmanbacteria bacterium RBG_16_43_7]
MTGKKIGKVTHYYSKIGVGIVKLSDNLKVGEKIKFVGNATEFEQTVQEMQYDHAAIETGKKGQEVGIKVDKKVKEDDEVYLL